VVLVIHLSVVMDRIPAFMAQVQRFLLFGHPVVEVALKAHPELEHH
jgi:hypothetical protein